MLAGLLGVLLEKDGILAESGLGWSSPYSSMYSREEMVRDDEGPEKSGSKGQGRGQMSMSRLSSARSQDLDMFKADHFLCPRRQGSKVELGMAF
jgi:hypothetical protein